MAGGKMLATVNQIYTQFGGADGLGRIVGSESEMDQAVREGLPVGVLHRVQRAWGLTVMEISASVAIPRSSLMQFMRHPKKMMSAAASDRVYRLASILALAEESLGDRVRALTWLRTPNRLLGTLTPLTALETEIGSQRVAQALGQIAYGGLS
jgi:putative toxin-antitoxin system antitoxin component (TIGR02293 family)